MVVAEFVPPENIFVVFTKSIDVGRNQDLTVNTCITSRAAAAHDERDRVGVRGEEVAGFRAVFLTAATTTTAGFRVVVNITFTFVAHLIKKVGS